MTMNVTGACVLPYGLYWDGANFRLGIGISAPTGKLHIQNEAGTPMVTLAVFSSDAAGPIFQYRKARGSIATPLGVNAEDVLFNVAGFGHDGTSYGAGAACSIRARAQETFTTVAHGAYFFISTCNIGSLTQTEKMRVTANGSVNIGGATTSTSKLNIAGLPTSAAGLAAGDVWVDTTGGFNILKIV